MTFLVLRDTTAKSCLDSMFRYVSEYFVVVVQELKIKKFIGADAAKIRYSSVSLRF